MALQSSAEAAPGPHCLRRGRPGWIYRLGAIWVEGQITQINRRPGRSGLPDAARPVADVSVQVTAYRKVFELVCRR